MDLNCKTKEQIYYWYVNQMWPMDVMWTVCKTRGVASGEWIHFCRGMQKIKAKHRIISENHKNHWKGGESPWKNLHLSTCTSSHPFSKPSSPHDSFCKFYHITPARVPELDVPLCDLNSKGTLWRWICKLGPKCRNSVMLHRIFEPPFSDLAVIHVITHCINEFICIG